MSFKSKPPRLESLSSKSSLLVNLDISSFVDESLMHQMYLYFISVNYSVILLADSTVVKCFFLLKFFYSGLYSTKSSFLKIIAVLIHICKITFVSILRGEKANLIFTISYAEFVVLFITFTKNWVFL